MCANPHCAGFLETHGKVERALLFQGLFLRAPLPVSWASQCFVSWCLSFTRSLQKLVHMVNFKPPPPCNNNVLNTLGVKGHDPTRTTLAQSSFVWKWLRGKGGGAALNAARLLQIPGAGIRKFHGALSKTRVFSLNCSHSINLIEI
ncbi:UNVERIFIED_CONTAM: hypothetical protein K2H54_070316 [Gekko kuhli]